MADDDVLADIYGIEEDVPALPPVADNAVSARADSDSAAVKTKPIEAVTPSGSSPLNKPVSAENVAAGHESIAEEGDADQPEALSNVVQDTITVGDSEIVKDVDESNDAVGSVASAADELPGQTSAAGEEQPQKKGCCAKCRRVFRSRSCICQVPFKNQHPPIGESGCYNCGCRGCHSDDPGPPKVPGAWEKEKERINQEKAAKKAKGGPENAGVDTSVKGKPSRFGPDITAEAKNTADTSAPAPIAPSTTFQPEARRQPVSERRRDAGPPGGRGEERRGEDRRGEERRGGERIGPAGEREREGERDRFPREPPRFDDRARPVDDRYGDVRGHRAPEGRFDERDARFPPGPVDHRRPLPDDRPRFGGEGRPVDRGFVERFPDDRRPVDMPPRFDDRRPIDAPPRFIDAPPRYDDRRPIDAPPRFDDRRPVDAPIRYDDRRPLDVAPRFDDRRPAELPARFDRPDDRRALPREPSPPRLNIPRHLNVCESFLRGNCRFGNDCKFIHPVKEDAERLLREFGAPQPLPVGGAGSKRDRDMLPGAVEVARAEKRQRYEDPRPDDHYRPAASLRHPDDGRDAPRYGGGYAERPGPDSYGPPYGRIPPKGDYRAPSPGASGPLGRHDRLDRRPSPPRGPWAPPHEGRPRDAYEARDTFRRDGPPPRDAYYPPPHEARDPRDAPPPRGWNGPELRGDPRGDVRGDVRGDRRYAEPLPRGPGAYR